MAHANGEQDDELVDDPLDDNGAGSDDEPPQAPLQQATTVVLAHESDEVGLAPKAMAMTTTAGSSTAMAKVYILLLCLPRRRSIAHHISLSAMHTAYRHACASKQNSKQNSTHLEECCKW